MAKEKTKGAKTASKSTAKGGSKTGKTAGKMNALRAALGNDKALLDIVQIIYDVEEAMSDFVANENIDSSLTGKERMRLFGAGVRNWGFIEKAYDICRDNPSFLPPHFSVAEFRTELQEFEEVRQLDFTLEQFMRTVNEALLLRSDRLFRLALRVYGNLRELARSKVPGAEDLFQALLRYFRHRRTSGNAGEQPTQKEIERGIHALMNGTADGKIVIENERPRVTAGKRVLVDEVSRSRAAVKETKQAEIDE